MNRCAIQQKSFASCEEMRVGDCRSMAICVDKKETVVCPKPRRVSLIHVTRPTSTTTTTTTTTTITTLNDSPVRPLRWHFSHQKEVCDSKAGNELLDIILAKGGYGAEQSVAQMASSPPFFSGSPPSRVSNPLIQDARFGDEKFTPISPRAIPLPSELAPSPSSTRKGGCVRTNFGNNPAVRIEGFECLDRDRRNCGIPALA